MTKVKINTHSPFQQLKKIAQAKQKDLNAFDIDEAVKIIAGSARSMGIQVKD